MSWRSFLVILFVYCCFCTRISIEVVIAECPDPKPNVVLLLVDDLGAKDLGVTGSRFYKTPQIDRLAKDSVHFRVAYATASVCSPSRGSLLTGLHPVDINITDWIPGNSSVKKRMETPEDLSELELRHTTIAERLSAEGYRTYFAGKWHLGGVGFTPLEQGFEYYFDPHDQPERGQPKNIPVGNDRPHATRVMTDDAIQFMNTEDDRPFFLMLSYYDVHTPIVPDNDFLPEYRRAAKQLPSSEPIREHNGLTRSQQDSPAYASMVSAVDQSVGRIMESLKKARLLDDTIVIFTSDNGGLSTLSNPGPTSNQPLRAGKGWLYEGGIRVPLIIKVPAQEASEVSVPVSLADLFPTIERLCHLDSKEGDSTASETRSIGLDLSFAWSEKAPPRDRQLIWHYPHYHGSTWTPGAALRLGDWKLIHFYEDEAIELYDLSTDPTEQNNLAKKNPAQAAKLKAQLRSWQKAHNAAFPKPRENE